MRHVPPTVCTPALLRELAALKSEGVRVPQMRERLRTAHGVYVSAQTVRNWLGGLVPKDVAAQLGPDACVPWAREAR